MTTPATMHEMTVDGCCARCGRNMNVPGAAATLCWGKPESRAPIQRGTIGEDDERSNQRGYRR